MFAHSDHNCSKPRYGGCSISNQLDWRVPTLPAVARAHPDPFIVSCRGAHVRAVESMEAHRRQLAHWLNRGRRRSGIQEYNFCEEFDTHDSTEKSSFELTSLRDRSGVCEILGASDIIFALSASGICTALSRVTKRRICILNVDPDQVIRSMFYNKANDSIITVSAFASEDFKILSCRMTPIECALFVRQAKPDAGFGLFEKEILNEQSFLEVDDVNGKILIYSDPDSCLIELFHFFSQIRDCSLAEVSRTEFVKPTSVIFLQQLHLFLTFHGRSILQSDYYAACSININDISTGKSLAKIRAGDLCKQKKTLEFQYTPSEALMDVTALYYDDAHEEIYTGNSEGFVHMWSS
ncbi:hypothetical protein PR202_ga09251 [Eleusine coracana subsp. coracana]|uniref:Uncharacterized protein n=1 Tax=Eleusine coracana subsp. coracana TaxID=191504 RepID=A0AAV5C3B3_ELECO|nr:hypothetical protein PR202_ga09251 [Eleusine coracana subsp. coracana]